MISKGLEAVKITKHRTFTSINKKKFRSLIEDAFGKKLAKNYFAYAKPKFLVIAKDNKNYVGTIVVEKIDKNVYYLDKIAVAKDFQGSGLGRRLWDILHLKSKKLVWRAKEDNPINSFYLKQCEGMQKVKNWIVYWKGLSPKSLEIGIKYALSKKKTLEEK